MERKSTLDAGTECPTGARALGLLGQSAVLVFGLFLFALSIDLQLKADLGLSPWDIFHLGLSNATGLTFGQVSILAGFAVIGITYAIARIKPGLGTVLNMVLIGVFIDLTLAHVPTMTQLPLQLVMFCGGVLLMGLATAIYIGARLGAGPRDTLMLGIHQASGVSVRIARTIVEASVFAAGVLLGGKFGLGTVLFLATIGPVVQLFLDILKVDARQ